MTRPSIRAPTEFLNPTRTAAVCERSAAGGAGSRFFLEPADSAGRRSLCTPRLQLQLAAYHDEHLAAADERKPALSLSIRYGKLRAEQAFPCDENGCRDAAAGPDRAAPSTVGLELTLWLRFSHQRRSERLAACSGQRCGRGRRRRPRPDALPAGPHRAGRASLLVPLRSRAPAPPPPQLLAASRPIQAPAFSSL